MVKGDAAGQVEKKRGVHHRYCVLGALLAIILFTSAIRVRLLEAPLERDEGACAYMGQLMLAGIPPYAESHDMKPPGLYAAYALIMAVFGQTIVGIHLGLLVVNAGTTVLLFLLAKRLFGDMEGLVTAAVFAVLSLGQGVQGVFANAEHFVILPAIGGILLLLRAVKSGHLLTVFLSGFLLGTGFIIKQPAACFIAFGGLYLLYSQFRAGGVVWSRCLLKCGLFAAGAVFPFTLSCLILWCIGVFDKFWFWTFTYPGAYVSSTPLSVGLDFLKGNFLRVTEQGTGLWILAGIGLTTIAWNKAIRAQVPFVVMFLVFSFFSVCPGLYFRPHYFTLLLPAASLLAGIGFNGISQWFSKDKSAALRKIVPVLIILIIIFQSVYIQRIFLFTASPDEVSRMTFGPNPFPESLQIAEYIQKHSSESDRIAVLGSEPQIYFYSRRRAATKYTIMYPIMGKHKYAKQMREQMIREIETNCPKFLVFVNIRASWKDGMSTTTTQIVEWFEDYSLKYYKAVGFADIAWDRPTVYRWAKDAVNYKPKSGFRVVVLERNE